MRGNGPWEVSNSGGGIPLGLVAGAVVAAAVVYAVVEVLTSAVFLAAAIVALSAACSGGVVLAVREVRRSQVPVRAMLPQRTEADVMAELVQARAQLAALERQALPAPQTALRGYVITEPERQAVR